jgi:ketosteroid isomerase-like protein
MSQENVEAFKRGLDAYNRRDLDALLEELDPDVEWHPALAVVLGGKQTVFRGHQGVRESIQEEDEALAEFQYELSEIRDLGLGSSRSDAPAFAATRAASRLTRPSSCWLRARARRAGMRGQFDSGPTSI